MDDWISVKEVAKRWGVSARVVQSYCKDGRVTGARKLGASWMLPPDARKPMDPRKIRRDAPSPLYQGLFLLESLRFDGRSPEAIAAELSSEDERLQFWAELAFFQGDTPRMLALFEQMRPDSPFALSALHGRSIACIQSGDYDGFMACMREMNRMRERYRACPQVL